MIFARTTAAVLTVGALAVGGAMLGAAPASAATPAASAATGVPADETVQAYRAQLNGLQTVHLDDFQCPADHPWLEDANLSPGRIVPPGVDVDEPGSIGVTISSEKADASGLTTGFSGEGSSATNWDVHAHVLAVSAVCTADRAQAYQVAG
ncbi:hypothetical protein [Pseudonocardia sp.]|jgi:hypothetical protein|uniref:hypothetical protein n=1 Tax=Pseudonocardia sp. TaxID=60912 RepID=UPI003D0D1007